MSLNKKANKTMKNYVKILCLLLIFYFNLLAQIYSLSTDDIQIQRVLNTDKANLCIAQDKNGLLWFSIWSKGLFCYDGNELKKHKCNK